MSKPILYIDMDGVCADFDAMMVLLLPNIDMGDGPDYEVRSGMVDEAARKYPTLFEDLELIPGALWYISILKVFYDIYFLSTPMSKIPESYMGKRKWIQKHFGDWAEKRLILTHRKDLCIGNYLVDDRDKNGAAEFTGELIKFGSSKFPDWKTVYNYLKPKEWRI